MNIAVIDAQGAGLGQTIIKKLIKAINKNNIRIIALGTNSTATHNMIKCGADTGITGEKPICSFCKSNKIDCIIGPIGAICSSGINGEITPLISKTLFCLDCPKYIIPLKKCGIYIPGTKDCKIKDMIEEIILDIKKSIL